jgi:hypothetical protein
MHRLIEKLDHNITRPPGFRKRKMRVESYNWRVAGALTLVSEEIVQA